MARESEGGDCPEPLRKGALIRVTAGPFIDFDGTIEEVDIERRKVRVILGTINPIPSIEFDLDQIERP